MKPGSLAIPPLAEEDIRDIAFPHQLAFDGWLNHLTHKRFLLPVLKYFWESVSRMWDNQPVWVELRGPAHWLMRFVAIEGPRQVHFPEDAMTDTLTDEDLIPASPEKPFEFHFRNPALDVWFDPDHVRCCQKHWTFVLPFPTIHWLFHLSLYKLTIIIYHIIQDILRLGAKIYRFLDYYLSAFLVPKNRLVLITGVCLTGKATLTKAMSLNFGCS